MNNRTLIIVEVLTDPTHDLIQEQMDSETQFIKDLIKKIETPTKTAFTNKPWNHLKDLGYSVTAEVLTRDKAKVISLLLPPD